MRKFLFHPSIADHRCASSDPGHHVDAGRFFMAVLKTTVAVSVTAEVLSDDTVALRWRDRTVRCWNHRTDALAAALSRTGGAAEWRPEWQVLSVPSAELADERGVFCLAGADDHTGCVDTDAVSARR